MAPISKIGPKRRPDSLTEYPVDFSTGERLFLPPRKMCALPKFEGGILVAMQETDPAMTPELKALCDELVQSSNGQNISGRALELLMQIAASLILKAYDASDDDLAEALALRSGTSAHDRVADQWPARIYRWVIGGDELTEALARNG